MAIKYQMLADKEIEGAWRVEALDSVKGDVSIAVFGGAKAEFNAAEYLAFKTDKLPKVSAPVPVPVPKLAPEKPIKIFGQTEEFLIVTDKGEELLIQPDRMTWRHNFRSEELTARPKTKTVRKKGD